MTRCLFEVPRSSCLAFAIAVICTILLMPPLGRAFLVPSHSTRWSPRTSTSALLASTASNEATATQHSKDDQKIPREEEEEQQQQQQQQRQRQRPLPTVEFIDPETQCKVVLLGCFHGTESSSDDVAQVVTPDTDVVVMELCTSRFKGLEEEFSLDEQQQQQQQPWMMAYLQMITKTVQQRGIPTGLAAAVLGGFSGLQTALSGFTPGLEFSTALQQARTYECDIVLGDQDVDETLRQMGSLPKISFDIAVSENRVDQWRVRQDTLRRAVGLSDRVVEAVPQVQLASVLLRNPAAIRDLVRLTIPPTALFLAGIQAVAVVTGAELIREVNYASVADLKELIPHWIASFGMLSLGYLVVALPAVGVVLTNRDEILTTGIQAACRRAGRGGRVVAVLGLLHVNGVADRMLDPNASATAMGDETRS